MKALIIFCLLASLLVVSAYTPGKQKKKQPVGKRISEEAYRLHVNGGKTHHTDGGVSIKTKPSGKRQTPEPEFTMHMALLQEQAQSAVKRHPHQLGCHYAEPRGHWDNTRTAPIRFVVNPTGSRTTAEAIETTFDLASRIIHEAVPTLKRPIEFTHLPTGHQMRPSSHVPANHTHIRNGINEISFAPRAFCTDRLVWFNGELHENHYDGNVILEAYIWVKTATKEIVEVDISFANNSNVEWHHFDDSLIRGGYTSNTITIDSHHFDSCGSAVWALCQGLGLQGTDAHDHTMLGMQARGTMHKRSLECGDKAGLQWIYRDQKLL